MLSVYNPSGQLVKTLRNGIVDAGEYSLNWNGTDASGASVPSGIYFYRLESGSEVLTRTMVLLK